jgi:hypothetical protein
MWVVPSYWAPQNAGGFPADSKNLAFRVGFYLQDIIPGRTNTVEVILDPLARSESQNPRGSYCTLLNPSRTWALISADQRVPETSNFASGAFGATPSEPLAETYRYALFFARSIGRIPVQEDLRT